MPTAPTDIYTLSLHDALPICPGSPPRSRRPVRRSRRRAPTGAPPPSSSRSRPAARRNPPSSRSEEHTSELQSPCNLVCRLLLEKKKNKQKHNRALLHILILIS